LSRLNKLKLTLGALVAVRLAMLVPAALERPYRGFEAERLIVSIPRGSSAAQIVAELKRRGVIERPWYFNLLIRWQRAAPELQAGTYAFRGASTSREVLHRLRIGDVVVRAIVVPEGSTVREIARAFEQIGLGTEREFLAAARAPELIADLDPKAGDLEGYLFPDTYHVTLDEGAAALVRRMVERFRQQLGDGLLERVRAQEHSVREIVTLASLVEEETPVAAERPLVAAVFANRLRRGMRLQCDPTVLFALERAGRGGRELDRSDLEFPSAYNTYLNAGLPPGPISSPGRAALEAALEPAAVRYLYFVADPQGGHRFSASLEEHNRQVYALRRARRQAEDG